MHGYVFKKLSLNIAAKVKGWKLHQKNIFCVCALTLKK